MIIDCPKCNKEKPSKEVDAATILMAILFCIVIIYIMWHCETENITLTNLVFGPDVNSSFTSDLLVFVGGGMIIGGIVMLMLLVYRIVFGRERKEEE